MASTELSAAFMGGESLLIECIEIWRGRGHRVSAIVSNEPVISRFAKEQGILLVAAGKGLAERLGAVEYDYFFSVANLEIVPQAVVDKARRGGINFHDGPLPALAGLNTPSWAILNGAAEHGITWHEMSGGIDEGAVLGQKMFAIEPGDTGLMLNTKCYEAGIETFAELVAAIDDGRLEPKPQDLSRRKYYGKYDRPQAACAIDWSASAEEIERFVSALTYGVYKNPLGFAKLLGPSINGRRNAVLVTRVEVAEGEIGSCGKVLSIDDKGIVVGTKTVPVRLTSFSKFCGSPLDAEGAAELISLKAHDDVSLNPAFAEQLTLTAALLAKSEEFWVRRLLDAEPAEAPYSKSSGAESAEVRAEALDFLGGDPARVIAIFTLWLAKATGKSRYKVGYVDDEVERELNALSNLFESEVPLLVNAESTQSNSEFAAALANELDGVRQRRAYPRDLVARTPGLRPAAYAVEIRVSKESRLSRDAKLGLQLGGGSAKLLYDASAFDADAVKSILRQLRALARSVDERSDVAVSDLSLLSDEERHQLLVKFNETAREFPRDRTVSELFEEQVQRTPDKVALVFEGRALSYGELNRRANQLARKLVELGAGPDVMVGLCVPRNENLVIGAIAIQKAGAAYVPLDPSYPADRIQFMAEDSGAPIIVTTSELASSLAGRAKLLELDTCASELTGLPSENLGQRAKPEHLAYVIYTSGSTGKPKGVMVEHHNVVNFFTGMDERIEHDDNSVWLAVTSLSFDISVLELFWTLARGFKVVLASEDRVNVASGNPNGNRKLDFSLFYFASDEGEKAADKYRLLLEGTRFADENGFVAVWTPERHFGAFGGLYPNPSVASAALATITKNVQLRAGSCVVPLHHPVRVAEEWALVDNLSNGRVGISFAAGWHPNDFLLRPENFADFRGAMARDIEVVRGLWRGETRTFEGPKGPVEIRTLPRPVQKELPFWLTAAGNPKTFEAAGKAGASVLTHLLGQTLDELAEKLKVYRKAWKDAGHPGEGYVSLMLHTFVGESDALVKERVREPMKGYLKSSITLIAQYAWAFPAFKRVAKEGATFEDNFTNLSEEDMDALLEYAFERYYETSGLFGTPETCAKVIERIKGMKVDDVACLIDYGIDSETVLKHLPLLNQVRLAAMPKSAAELGEDYSIATQIGRHRVTHLQCTPSMARLLMTNEESRAALPSLKQVMVGGEALSAALAQEIQEATGGAILSNMYGPTETTIWSSTDRVDAGKTITIGTPIANTQLYVLDPTMKPLPIGVPGELYIGGEGVTRGYHARPELTSERFVTDPFVIDPSRQAAGARLYRTGDLVRYLSDGRIEFLGRIDHQVKVRGYRIELGEIEARLNQHGNVRESVVVVREDTVGDPRIIAYFVAKGGTPSLTELRDFIGQELPSFMVPSHFVGLDSFPLTPNAKVDRKALPSPDKARVSAAAEYVEPENQTEETIAKIWQSLLGVEKVGSHDNFFELGGHSLLAVRAHRELRAALNQELTITDIFRFPTVRALSDYLSGADGGSARLNQTSERVAARRDALAKRKDLRARRVQV